MFSDDVKEYMVHLRGSPMYQKMIDQIEESKTVSPKWTIQKPLPESASAFYSGVETGEGNVISILKGEI